MTKRKSAGSGVKSTGGGKAAKTRKGASEAGAANRPYVVLARKYRPATFDDLIGQDAMVRTLEHAFTTGRIAQAYMLTGVRGVGKTTTARILARALNYEADGSGKAKKTAKSGAAQSDGPTIHMPGHGVHCAAIMESRHPDVIEMDAASNTGVDNVREIIESARYRPVSARFKVFIIDEVHMLSKGAFNALLKTLEEPPGHVKFIFATTEVRKVPVTVLSRCQRFDLKRVEVALLAAHFGRIAEAEGGRAEEDALRLIARAAEGSVRDGLSILDQALAIGSGTITTDDIRAMLGLADRGRILGLLEVLFGGDGAGALAAYDALHRDGAEPAQILRDLAEAVHIMTRLKVAGEKYAADALAGAERARASELAGKLALPLLARAWQVLVKGCQEIGQAPDASAGAEMVLVRLAYTAALPSPDDLLKKLATGAPAESDAAPSASPADQRSDPVARIDDNPPASPAEPPPPVTDAPRPTCFDDIATLAGEMRDIRLKLELEDKVHPVSFEPGRLEVALDASARPELANELTKKLRQWTGVAWVVIVSNEAGSKTLAERKREHEAAEIALVEGHPLVREVFAHFPDASIEEVRPLDPDATSATPATSPPKASEG